MPSPGPTQEDGRPVEQPRQQRHALLWIPFPITALDLVPEQRAEDHSQSEEDPASPGRPAQHGVESLERRESLQQEPVLLPAQLAVLEQVGHRQHGADREARHRENDRRRVRGKEALAQQRTDEERGPDRARADHQAEHHDQSQWSQSPFLALHLKVEIEEGGGESDERQGLAHVRGRAEAPRDPEDGETERVHDDRRPQHGRGPYTGTLPALAKPDQVGHEGERIECGGTPE